MHWVEFPKKNGAEVYGFHDMLQGLVWTGHPGYDCDESGYHWYAGWSGDNHTGVETTEEQAKAKVIEVLETCTPPDFSNFDHELIQERPGVQVEEVWQWPCTLTARESRIRFDTLTMDRGNRSAMAVVSGVLQIGYGLVTLHGRPARGKTALLIAGYNHARHNGTPAIYRGVPELLDELRGLYDLHRSHEPDGNQFLKSWHTLMGVPVLCLDEADKWSPTDWARERVAMMLDTRYRMRETHVTLVAVNTIKGLSPHLQSRLQDQDCPYIEVKGFDIRKGVGSGGRESVSDGLGTDPGRRQAEKLRAQREAGDTKVRTFDG